MMMVIWLKVVEVKVIKVKWKNVFFIGLLLFEEILNFEFIEKFYLEIYISFLKIVVSVFKISN